MLLHPALHARLEGRVTPMLKDRRAPAAIRGALPRNTAGTNIVRMLETIFEPELQVFVTFYLEPAIFACFGASLVSLSPTSRLHTT